MTIIRVFDIETTGIDPKEDRIVEIAAYDVDTLTSDIVRVGDNICNPKKPIPPAASAVHHLTDADVINAPEFDEVWRDYIFDPVAIFAAHNSAFESSFLPTPAGVNWICTYKAALHAWPDAPGHSNQVIRYWRDFDNRPSFSRSAAALSHRASPDAYVTAHILLDLLKIATPEQLIKCTQQPKRYPMLTFGKHYGARWTDVPIDYLEWLRDGKHDMDDDWRVCAGRELNRRKEQK